MSARAIETTFRVGRRWRVSLRVPLDGAVEAIAVDWHPDAPGRRLNKRELRDYRRGVEALASEWRAATGRLPIMIDSMFARGVAAPREEVTATLALVSKALAAGRGNDGKEGHGDD